jgi:putative Mn2+ efflux pump MntP
MYTTDGNIAVILFMTVALAFKELVTSKRLGEKIKKTFDCIIANPKYRKNLHIFFKIYLFLYLLFHFIYTLYFKFHMISWFDARQLTLPYLIFITGLILYFLLARFNNNKKRESYQKEVGKKKEDKFLRMKRIFTISICLQIQNTGLTFLLVTLNNLPYTQNLELLSIFATIPLWFVLLGLAIKYLKNGFSREDGDQQKKEKDTDENFELMKIENAATSKDEA